MISYITPSQDRLIRRSCKATGVSAAVIANRVWLCVHRRISDDRLARFRSPYHRPFQPAGRPISRPVEDARRHADRRRAVGAVLAAISRGFPAGRWRSGCKARELPNDASATRSADVRPIPRSTATASPTTRRWPRPRISAPASIASCDEMAHHRVCLMCSEREPLDCHRCLLVGRALARRGVTVGHILGDGSIEPHAATEDRLLAGLRPGAGADLFGDRESRLADAYRRRATGSPPGCPTGSARAGRPGPCPPPEPCPPARSGWS